MERRSKRWTRNTFAAGSRGSVSAVGTRSGAWAKGRTEAALHRQLAGYAVLGVRLGALTPSLRRRAWVAIATTAQPLRDRVRWLPLAPTRLRLVWREHHFSYVVGDRSELDVLDGVFLRQDYDVSLLHQPTTIVGLGSNAGATIHYWLDSIDVLKIDIEGAEHDVLESFTRIREVAAVVGEYHPAIHGRRFEELESVFEGFDLDVRRNRAGVRHFRAVRRSSHGGPARRVHAEGQ